MLQQAAPSGKGGIDYSRFDKIEASSSSGSEEEDYDERTGSDDSDDDEYSSDDDEGEFSLANVLSGKSPGLPTDDVRPRRPGKPLFVDCPPGYQGLLYEKFWGLPSEFKPEEDEDKPGCIHQCVGCALTPALHICRSPVQVTRSEGRRKRAAACRTVTSHYSSVLTSSHATPVVVAGSGTAEVAGAAKEAEASEEPAAPVVVAGSATVGVATEAEASEAAPRCWLLSFLLLLVRRPRGGRRCYATTGGYTLIVAGSSSDCCCCCSCAAPHRAVVDAVDAGTLT